MVALVGFIAGKENRLLNHNGTSFDFSIGATWDGKGKTKSYGEPLKIKTN